jgi:hypothetical protein
MLSGDGFHIQVVADEIPNCPCHAVASLGVPRERFEHTHQLDQIAIRQQESIPRSRMISSASPQRLAMTVRRVAMVPATMCLIPSEQDVLNRTSKMWYRSSIDIIRRSITEMLHGHADDVDRGLPEPILHRARARHDRSDGVSTRVQRASQPQGADARALHVWSVRHKKDS